LGELTDILILAAAGLGGGILAGMLGIGGGVVYVLIFSYYLQRMAPVPLGKDMVQILVANSAFALIFAGLSGSIRQYLVRNFYPRFIFWLAVSGAISAVLTTLIIEYTGVYTPKEFAVVFSLLMVPIMARMVFQERFTTPGNTFPVSPYSLLITGFLAGAVMALSGLGGGFVIIPVLNGLFRVPIKKTVSISLAFIAIVAAVFSLYNLFFVDYSQYQLPGTMGAIVFPLVLPVLAGVIMGAPLGVHIGHRLPNRVLRIIFVAFCLFVIVRLIVQFYS
jgi:uncharacterized protein